MGTATRLGELAALVGGAVRGDSGRLVRGIRSLEEAGPHDLAPLTSPQYRAQARSSRAGALLVPQEEAELPQDQLVCAAAAWALAPLLEHFHPASPAPPGAHATALVGEGCVVDETAHLGPYVVVGDGSRIEADAQLHAGVVVGRRCRIGARVVLYPRVVLYDDTELGAGVVIHAGAVLGSDGFGYAPHEGRLVKIPQVGKLVVEEGVEIGANTTVDRATLEETRIGAESKLDNLVQVGHNVRLGPGCVICGQAGIAGSARLGRGVVMGGQSGAIGHVDIGDGVQIAGGAGAMQGLSAGARVAGTPAVELGQWRRQTVWVSRLGELFRRVRALERRGRGGKD